ncbi:hypothetical protein TOPH_09193 [Tolypocladium ophioglossoides CBS 100239]|uniref:Uncharacterized protein n=1 Tax=Tolypocladium ophioglossoides (strain CBS 100239) TaxID=1163406 RepID=A0A0L0MWM1_TOLOC|nr:hypothetical protein TOPH_09193 [Tolypocladium ophioglossoides CBS 100239]
MALPTSSPDVLFEEDKVSFSVSAVDSRKFLQEHGIFYQANAEIGKLVAKLDSQGLAWKSDVLSRYMPILLEDPRLREILEHFDTERPSLCFYLDSDNPKHYFASTIEENEAQDHRAVIYMWSAQSHLEFFVGSHKLPSKGVKAANGLFEVPYPFLTVTKKLKESGARLGEGGVMIVHPRFSFGSTSGFTMAYALQEKEYLDKRVQNT